MAPNPFGFGSPGMGEPMQPKKYSLKEISLHNKPEDCWLIVNGKVYDVTSWVPSHPGGTFIYVRAGQDCTYLFNSYHPLYVRKVLPQYYIGEVQYSVDDSHLCSSNVEYLDSWNDKFYLTVKERVETLFRKENINSRVHPHMYLKSIFVIMAYVLCYYLTCFYKGSFMLSFISSLGLGFSLAQIGLSIMHDSNHGAYSTCPWLGYAMAAIIDFVGASSFMWRHQHVIGHHCYTNVNKHDPDIRVKDPDIRRVIPQHPWRSYHVYQHLYLGVLYGFLATKSIFFDDFSAYLSGSIGPVKVPPMTPLEFYVFFGGKLFYAIHMLIIPSVFSHHSWLALFVLYLSSQLIAGWTLALMFQVAHVVEEAEFFDADIKDGIPTLQRGWAASQIRTTTNFNVKSLLWTHLSGGLNHQIEHHLFPAICHLHYPKIQPIVEATSKEFGIPYRCYPTMWDAVKAHFAYLRKVGVGNMDIRLIG